MRPITISTITVRDISTDVAVVVAAIVLYCNVLCCTVLFSCQAYLVVLSCLCTIATTAPRPRRYKSETNWVVRQRHESRPSEKWQWICLRRWFRNDAVVRRQPPQPTEQIHPQDPFPRQLPRYISFERGRTKNRYLVPPRRPLPQHLWLWRPKRNRKPMRLGDFAQHEGIEMRVENMSIEKKWDTNRIVTSFERILHGKKIERTGWWWVSRCTANATITRTEERGKGGRGRHGHVF